MNRQDQFIPHLVVSDGLAALEFYKTAFAAEEGDRMMAADGKRLMHGEIILDGHKLSSATSLPQARAGPARLLKPSVELACALLLQLIMRTRSSNARRRAARA
jgi:uncharacterized glyoxalase superfamily protein PhnB